MADNADILSDDELAAYEAPSPAAMAAVAPPAAQPSAPASDALTPDELAAYEAVVEPQHVAAVPPAVDEPAAAPAPMPEPETVQLVAPDESLVDVPIADADRAVRVEGYRIATAEDASEAARQAALQAQYGDFGGKVVAGTQGTARGLTLGLSDYAGRVASGVTSGLLGPDVPIAAGPGLDAPLVERGIYDEAAADAAAAETKAYQEANPVTATATEIGGAIAPALLSGGATAGGSAALTAARLTPAGQLARLGVGLTEALGKKAAEKGLGVLGRIGASALGAGVEGAVDNATRVAMDDLMQSGVDQEALARTAERMLPAAWDGFKYGAILGGGGHAVAEGVGRLAQGRAAREVLEQADEAFPTRPLPEPDLPPPEAVRPAEEIAADIEAAQKRLNDAEASGLSRGADEAEQAVGELLAEQEKATLAREGLSSNDAIEAKLRLEPTPETMGLIERIDAHLNTAKNADDLERKLGDVKDVLEKEITGSLDNMSRLKKNTVDVLANKATMPAVVRDMVAREGAQWTPDVAQKWMGRLEELETAFDDVLDGTKQTSFKPREVAAAKAGKESLAKMRQYLTSMAKGEQGPIAPGARIEGKTIDDVVETILGFDDLKSHLGTFAQESAGRPATKSQALFQRLYMQVRADLQNPKLVGQSFATFQTAKNAAQTRSIRLGRLLRDGYASANSFEAGGAYNFGDVIEFDPKKVGAVLDDLANPRARKELRNLVAGATAEVETMETMAKYFPMPPAALASIKAQRQALDTAVNNLRGAQALAVKADEARRLAKQTTVAKVIIDGIKGLPGGAALANFTGALTGGAKALSAGIVALGQGAAKSERGLARAAGNTVKNFVERTPEEAAKARKVVPIRAAKGDPPHLRGVGITANELRKAIEEAEALQSADSDESRALEQQLADIRDESPELADAIGAKVREKAAFIVSKVPPPDTGDPFRRSGVFIDPMTERSVARYVAASRDPEAALDRMADGTGTPEDRETLQALYPALYRRYASQVEAQMQETKRVPTPQQRQALHFATGVVASREQQPGYMLKRRDARQNAGASQMREPESEQLKPMVTPSNAKTEFSADKRFASRTDAIMGGAD